jgi:Peptidase A4 family
LPGKAFWIMIAAVGSVVIIGAAEFYVISSLLVPSSSSQPSTTPTSTLTSPVSTDLNWGGYAVASDFNNPLPVVTSVSASWVVPAVQASQTDSFSAVWVGIGGTFGNTLIQTGTEQDCIGGEILYSAWFELLPRDSVTITTVNISPGDVINASITLVDSNLNSWQISLVDLTNGQSFSQNVFYASSQLSAEWIIERPTVDNVLSALANFGTVPFSNCEATVESCLGTAGQFSNIQNVMTDRQGAILAEASNLSSDGSSFSVKYLQSQ